MNDEEQYYRRYEDRYQRVHGQGYRYWNPFPARAAEMLKNIDAFLDYGDCLPLTASVIEFGCGEGFIGEYLLRKGYRYLGLDISPSAIRNARQRIGISGETAFRQMDIVTGLDAIPTGSFAAAIDNQCLHMLVTGEHRFRYLVQIRRLLKPGRKVFFNVNYREEEFPHVVTGYADWLKKTGDDYSILHDYDLVVGEERHTIRLPRLPARANNEAGYRKELEKAGLAVEYFASDGWQCIIYAGNLLDNGVKKRD